MGFDCSMETMVRRVLRRGQVEHRADDSEPAIRKRLETHYTLCEPVLTFYQQKNLLRNVRAWQGAPGASLHLPLPPFVMREFHFLRAAQADRPHAAQAGLELT